VWLAGDIDIPPIFHTDGAAHTSARAERTSASRGRETLKDQYSFNNLKIPQNMEIKLQIGYEQMLDMLRQLPQDELLRLLTEMQRLAERPKPLKGNLSAFLLSGPTMSAKQYNQFVENRKLFSQWR
jgi:hypothetical protein